MAPAIQKRRRNQQLVTSMYQQSLRAVFAKALGDAKEDEEQPARLSSPKTQRFSTARYSTLGPLCDRLDCVSRPNTVAVLDEIIHLIQTRATTISELTNVLFGADEDADMLPSLCAIVRLLRAKCLHVVDFHYGYVIKRAVYELERADACVCRGLHTGVLSIIDYLLDGHRGSARDAVLRDFVSVYFHRPSSILGDTSLETRFRLAMIVIKYLHEAWTKHGERVSTVVTWARQAVTPSRFLEVEHNNAHVIVRSSRDSFFILKYLITLPISV